MARLIILETCVSSNKKKLLQAKTGKKNKLFSQETCVRTQLLKQISLCTQLRKHTHVEWFVSKGQGQWQNVQLSLRPQLRSYANTRLQ